MADQMSAPVLPMYGHKIVRTPNLEKIADSGVIFENAYCNFPLCAPSRFSMMSGQLCSRIGAYDNGAEFPASIPTFIHYVRVMGYHTSLIGKMHFVGPDQLHGFEERLTTDVYPADFGWTAAWDRKGKKYASETGGGVTGIESLEDSGICERSLNIDYDEEVYAQTVRKLYDLARDPAPKPFFMCVSFSNPHDPYTATPEFWGLYDHKTIDLPSVPLIPYAQQDAHSQRLYRHIGADRLEPDEKLIRKCRHGYYGAISYIDDKVGKIIDVLKRTGLRENTIIFFTSDHGEMLGERGMWFKSTFYEWAMRVPLIFNAPDRFKPRRVARNVSLVDLLPTVVELGGGSSADIVGPIDGNSLCDLLQGRDEGWPDVVYAEQMSEHTDAPRFMIRKGRYKYVYSEDYPAQLFDLSTDPQELADLAGNAEHAEVEDAFAKEVQSRWNLKDIEKQVIQNQYQRRLVFEALVQGHRTPWDFQPLVDASRQYVRYGDRFPDVEQKAILRQRAR